MKKHKIIIIALFLLATSAYAAPSYIFQRTIFPEINNTYDLGSSTQAWRNIYTVGTTSSGVFQATSTTATSTGANGWNLTAGCFAINNTCVGGSSGTSFSTSSIQYYLSQFGDWKVLNTLLTPTTSRSVLIPEQLYASSTSFFDADLTLLGGSNVILTTGGGIVFPNGGGLSGDSANVITFSAGQAANLNFSLLSGIDQTFFYPGKTGILAMLSDIATGSPSKWATSTASTTAIHPNSLSTIVGISTTTPGTRLSVGGIANFHTATSSFYSSGGIDILNGCFAINGTCVVRDVTGNWTGTFDGQEGSWYIANSFSTTSADWWDTTKSRWATTSSDFWVTASSSFSVNNLYTGDITATGTLTMPIVSTPSAPSFYWGRFFVGQSVADPNLATPQFIDASSTVYDLTGGGGGCTAISGGCFSDYVVGALASSSVLIRDASGWRDLQLDFELIPYGFATTTQGGTGFSTTTTGTLLLGVGTNQWGKLAIGANNKYLRSNGTTLVYDDAVDLTTQQTIAGRKIFTLYPEGPGSAPTTSVQLTDKAYVDAIAQGLDLKTSVKAATVAALTASTTYNNGTLGVGATITSVLNVALQTIDGVTLSTSSRALIKDQATTTSNGIYEVTQLGGGGQPYILTRTTDFDSDADVDAGSSTFVEAGGATNGAELWAQLTADPITIGTSALVFTQIGASTAYTASTGIQLVGSDFRTNLLTSGGLYTDSNQLGVLHDNSTLATSTGLLAVKTAGITGTQLAVGSVVLTSTDVTGTLPVANGGTNLTAASDDNAMIGNGTTWESKAFTDCDGSSNALTYDTATNALGCNTISGGGGGSGGTIATTTNRMMIFGVPNINTTLRVWSNMPTAKSEIFGTTGATSTVALGLRPRFDTTYASSYRITARKGAAGVAASDINLECSASDGSDQWYRANTVAGQGEAVINTGTQTTIVGSTGYLVSLCKGDKYWRIVGKDGNGTADPSFAWISVDFDFPVGGGPSSDWIKQTTFATLSLTPSTTIPIWAKSAIYGSSTLQIDGKATTTGLLNATGGLIVGGTGSLPSGIKQYVVGGGLLLDNAQAISFLDSGGVQRNVFSMTSADNAQFSNAAANGAMQFINASDNTNGIRMYTATSTANRLWIDEQGNVQFNVTASSSNFTVKGNTDSSLFFINGTTNRVGVSTSSPGSLFSVGGVANFRTGTTTFYSSGGIDLVDGCFSIDGTCVGGGSSQWTTSGTNIHYSSGNVGIGTSTPWALLSVNGTTPLIIAATTTAVAPAFMLTSTTSTLTLMGSSSPATYWKAAFGTSTDQMAHGTGMVVDGTVDSRWRYQSCDYMFYLNAAVTTQTTMACGPFYFAPVVDGSILASVADSPSYVRLSGGDSSVTANDGANLRTLAILTSSSTPILESVVRIPTQNDNAMYFVGFAPGAISSVEPANGVYFVASSTATGPRVNNVARSGMWAAVTRVGSVSTVTFTGVATSSRYQKLRVEMNGDGNNNFYINDQLVATHSGQHPEVPLDVNHASGVLTGAGGTARLLDISRLRLWSRSEY